MVSWKCTGGCHGNGHEIFFGTNCTILNLRWDQRYLCSVNAVTDFGTGETSTISVLISLHFAQVRNLRASIDDNYNMAITWDRPNNFDKDDIKVPFFIACLTCHFGMYCHLFVAVCFIFLYYFNHLFFSVFSAGPGIM